MGHDEKKKRHHHHHKVACCLLLTIIVVLGILALALYLYYRPLSPRVVATPVDVSIEEFSLLPPALALSVAVHVVVSNPSNAPYRYRETATAVTYHGEPVGVTVVPAGEVGARAVETQVEPVTEVDGLRVAESPCFAEDAAAGMLPFVAVARLEGKAVVLRSIEVSVTVEVVCHVLMYVFHGESSSRCVSRVHTPGLGWTSPS